MVIFTTGGNILIKLGAPGLVFGKSLKALIRSGFNKHFVLGCISVLFAAVAYIFALTRVPLNIAYSFTGFNYIFVFLAGWKILKEDVKPVKLGGIVLILTGSVVWNI